MEIIDRNWVRLRADMDAVPDDVLAREHVQKIRELARLRKDIEAAQAALLHNRTPQRGSMGLTVERVTGLVRDPSRLAAALAYRASKAVALVSSVPEAVAREGGFRPAARKTLGLLLRDGPRGVPPMFPVTVRERRHYVINHTPVRPHGYSDTDPEVSVVVLNWNRSDMTVECLRSLWEHTAGHTYEIVLVDNGSRPSDVDAFDRLEGPCTVVRLGLNRYFGEGNNLGVEHARGRFVCFMNNDVTVTEGWLEPLMSALQGSDDCGAAGPMFLYPNGLLQEAGGFLDEEANSVQVGKYQDPRSPEFNYGRPVDYVSAACCLVRKDDFERVLGFDMRYEPAYYEDADLCMKLGQLGLKTVYVPQSQVVHHESATTSDSSHGLELSSISELNRSKFLSRWGGYLRTGRHAEAPEPVQLIRCGSSRGKRTLGVFSPFELTPGGGERYLLTLAMAGLQRGLNVHFVSPAPYSSLRMSALAMMFGLDLEGLCITSIEEARRLPLFDEWVAMSNQVVPSAPGLGTRNTLLCQFPFPAGVEEWRKREAWLKDYERIAVYSEFTGDAVRRTLAKAHVAPMPIEILTPPVDVTQEPIRPSKCGIVSAGRFFAGDHSKRQDLQIEVFRRLVASGSGDGVTLHLVGSSATHPNHRRFLVECMRAAEGLNVEFHVDAPLAEVREVYANSSLYWHSSGLGIDPNVEPERCEHFGITPIEAMAHGTIPLVVGNGGPAVTVRDGVDGYHYGSMAELAERTAELLSCSDEELRPMRESARARAQEFSQAAFLEASANLFDM